MVDLTLACACRYWCLYLLVQLENTSQQNSANSRSSGIRLPWMCRLSIATDTARGLAYLHTADKLNPLVHRDVKRWGFCTGDWGWGWVQQVSGGVNITTKCIALSPARSQLFNVHKQSRRAWYAVACDPPNDKVKCVGNDRWWLTDLFIDLTLLSNLTSCN